MSNLLLGRNCRSESIIGFKHNIGTNLIQNLKLIYRVPNFVFKPTNLSCSIRNETILTYQLLNSFKYICGSSVGMRRLDKWAVPRTTLAWPMPGLDKWAVPGTTLARPVPGTGVSCWARHVLKMGCVVPIARHAPKMGCAVP